jgi:hypothetical protein
VFQEKGGQAMHVDQKHVTAISLRDGRDRDCVLLHDGAGYRLSLISRDDIVNIFLSPSDLQKLHQEVVAAASLHRPVDAAPDFTSLKTWTVHAPCAAPMHGAGKSFAWGSAEWLAYN